ncbi:MULTISPECIES: hypothetical protein [unclassified Sporosarcina]|uniref:hypothetical protein n=1 Tax=unclassified Sporosarcina TaxID=2647733 RepID=UPI002040E0BF|nr:MULTISPECIES: hypothetical protein [unclassified Sporosarcina]GKV65592.1 hypothetical protein NCCP2331_17450 [Sporosarcina sp. NCCP-2331]GLB55828.1 hypothetical protein NCCP2378_16150 [Sporosarcina sp. NCCP-2378]
MNNMERIKLETKGIQLTDDELKIYLQENGLEPLSEYKASNLESQKAVYTTTLSILESLANNPENYKNIKMDDLSVSQFSENIQKRIYHLTRKIRTMKTETKSTDTFMLYL